LRLAEHTVHRFHKSRRPGGRLATRRVAWVDRQGQAHTTRLDHGVVGITARSAAFHGFVDHAVQEGGLAEWAPRLAAGSLPLECGDRVLIPVPDMSAPCRRPLEGTSTTWPFAVDRLQRGPLGLEPSAPRTAGRVGSNAIASRAVRLAGPGARLAAMHNAPPARRTAQSPAVATAEPCWWDAAEGLGVCGDVLGGCGVEDAWSSAQWLCSALSRQASDAADTPSQCTAPGTVHPIAA
jgi:hypothetical protein